MNKKGNISSLKPFNKGEDGRRNKRGANKGSKWKIKQLRILIKDLAKLNKSEISWIEKQLIYDIYKVALVDYTLPKNKDYSISHLYFMESDFGIKIGISKQPNKRLVQIRQYAKNVKLIKVIKHGGSFEKHLHNKFKNQNIKNNPTYGIEWFYKNDDLINFIDELESVEDLVMLFGSKRAIQLTLF